MPRLTPMTAALAALLVLTMTVLPAPIPAPAAAAPADAPPPLTAAAVAWLTYTRGAADFAGRTPDAVPAFTGRLLALYAAAAAQEPLPPDQIVSPPFAPPRDYAPRLQILTAAGELITLRARPNTDSQVDIRWATAAGSGSRTVAAPELHSFIATAADHFPPRTPLTVTPREGVRVGTTLHLTGGDLAPATALHIFLAPTRPWGPPEAGPPPYPTADAALLATYRDFAGGSLDLGIELTPEMGTLPDGQPLRPVPGPYAIVVVSEGLPLATGEAWGGFRWEAGFTLLPEPPEPRAVAVQGDRVVVWTPDGGVTAAPLPAGARPLPGPHLSTLVPSALAPYLGLTVTRAEPAVPDQPAADAGAATGTATEVWSAGTAAVTLTAGSPRAGAGHGGLDLFFPAEATLDPPGLVVNFSQLAPFFEYEVRWVGPDEVYFRRGLAAEPAELLAALGHLAPPTQAAMAIAINGQPLAGPPAILVDGTTYLPLRAAGEALGAHVHWDAATATGYLQAPGWQVMVPPDRVEVVRGSGSVTLGHGPVNREGRLFVPLRALVETLGGQVVWDPERWTIWITLP